jgi:hypothetical protein
LDALAAVKPDARNPMDLTLLDCGTFTKRHAETQRSDPDSARTIMMWLFGFAVGEGGGHVFDADRISAFEPAFMTACAGHPQASVFDTLKDVKF